MELPPKLNELDLMKIPQDWATSDFPVLKHSSPQFHRILNHSLLYLTTGTSIQSNLYAKELDSNLRHDHLS